MAGGPTMTLTLKSFMGTVVHPALRRRHFYDGGRCVRSFGTGKGSAEGKRDGKDGQAEGAANESGGQGCCSLATRGEGDRPGARRERRARRPRRLRREHRLGVAGGQDQAGALALFGADGTEDVGRGGALIARSAGAGPALGPPARNLVLSGRCVPRPDRYQISTEIGYHSLAVWFSMIGRREDRNTRRAGNSTNWKVAAETARTNKIIAETNSGDENEI